MGVGSTPILSLNLIYIGKVAHFFSVLVKVKIMGIITNLSALLSGKGNTYHGSRRSKAFQEVLDTGTNEETYLGDLLRKYTGSALTSAEREANAFTAQREDIAWERQMAASNTAYQRQVADLKAAGLNPMLAVNSSGASSPSMSTAGSVSPSGAALNLGSLISAMTGAKVAQADIALKEAQANKANAEAASTEQQTSYFDRVQDIRAEAEKLSNNMTRSEMREIEHRIVESKARVGRELANTKESEARASLAVEEALLAHVNADNIKFMQPFVAGELSARSARERAEARVAGVEAAFKQNMIDLGAIEAAIRKDNASASDFEIQAKTKEFAQSIADGSLRKAADKIGDWRSSVIIGLYEAINNSVKSALGKW